MVKQYLAAVLEDLIGEYVLNISKENLKLAALQGKIKLDNVELDGDYIGSHVLGAVGLQGFGVLSCWARSLQISIPWKNLNEPTSLEIHSMHLVCVPLLPTTATRMYYGGGISGGSLSSQTSLHDGAPRCSLRTRAKRSAIARFERNFFSGRIPGEGPQLEKEESDSKTLRYNGRRRRWSLSVKVDGDGFVVDDSDTDSMNDFPVDHVRNSPANLNEDPENNNAASSASKQTFKEKISTKIYQNLISSINDVHIRFEVPEGGLDMSLTGKHTFDAKRCNNTLRERLAVSDHRAFAFGLTLQRLSVQNVSEDVQKNDTDSKDCNDKARKTIEIRNMSMYWDDGPSFLLTESDSMKGLVSIPVQKLQRRIAEVMKQMSARQDPGDDLKKKLSSLNSPARVPFVRKHSNSNDFRSHEFICANISQIIHTTFSRRATGNSSSSYLVELLPCKIEIDVTSQQYRQYQLLKNAVLSQQRFDTMLHGRPKESVLDNPRSWWRYAILCVQHRPNSRPWSDVQQIVRCRKKYVNLVVKNLQSETDQSGFHGGLSSLESQALLELESFLPIETLLAFHLLALREVFDNRCDHKKVASAKAGLLRKSRGSNSISRFWKSISGSKTSSWRPLEDYDYDAPALPLFPSKLDSASHASTNVRRERESVFLDDSLVSNGAAREPSTETICRLEKCEIRICLLDLWRRTKIVATEVAMRGNSFNSGEGKEEYICEILRFDVYDFVTSGAVDGGKVLSVQPSFQGGPAHQGAGTANSGCIADDKVFGSTPATDRVSSSTSIKEDLLLHMMSSHENDLPLGIVCRVTAVANEDELSLAFVAHPATIVWNNACAEAVADFFSTSTLDVKSQFLNQLRSAATPGAHKRQIELLFPTSLSISIGIDAPKLWVPVSSQTMDGALYLDAGKLKMAAFKPKKTSVTRWALDLSDIQIKFSRGETGSLRGTGKFDEAIDLVAVNCLGNEFTVIYPFHIGVTGIATESIEIPLENHFTSNLDGPKESISGEVSATVGKIQLNLVDVEELAKAVGRFYASEMIRIKTKAKDNVPSNTASESQIISQRKHGLSDAVSPDSPAIQVLVVFEEIEVALESYVPAKNVDKTSTRNRTYLIEIFRITLQRRSKGVKQFSRLTVSDFSIAQLTEIKRDGHRMPRLLKPSDEPQHQILGKKVTPAHGWDRLHESLDTSPPLTPKLKTEYHPLHTPRELRVPSAGKQMTSPGNSPMEFIRACHFHDGENHVDEVEVDVCNMIVRITPTSIVDLKISLTRLFELIQLTSKEMERRVHEGRRRAIRAHKSRSNLNGLHATTIFPSASLPEEEYVKARNRSSVTDDSSVIFRVTFEGVSLFVGRPASEFTSSRASKRHGSAAPHDYVVQILTNASVLVQSIENPDSSGSKTMHVSLEDLSASISNSWTDNRGSNKVVSPTELDFRAVYQTVDEGSMVCQDFSLNCESLECCMLPHDVTVVLSITRKVVERLQALRKSDGQTSSHSKARKGFLPSLVHIKQRGSGIATNVRFDLSHFSFVSIHAFELAHARPFLDLNIDQLKIRLDGIAACLTGELSAIVKLNFFHPLSGWEHLIEPFQMHVDIEQMPDEQIFTVTSAKMINMNFTGFLLQELSSLERFRKRNISCTESSRALSDAASRMLFSNYTGIDLNIGISSSSHQSPTEIHHRCIKNGECVALEALFPELTDVESHALSLTAPQRKTLSNLPLVPSSDRSAFLFKWYSFLKPTDNRFKLYDLEPVVEFVMQNQRLRSSVADVFSLDKGQDFLQSTNWSPEFNSHDEAFASSKGSKYLWQKPYLEGDAPEFSDMTCRLKCTKDSIILPGNDWIWADDWEVEIHDELGVTNDADGWEYEADFDTFTAVRRFYKRGDTCRRRRWTRHRIIKPLKLDDPLKVFLLVWELKKEENGSIAIKARSHLSLHNQTSIPLAFFGHCVCWENDHFIGYAFPGSTINVPLQLAFATHLRLAVPKNTSCMHDMSKLQIAECFASNRVMILSSGIDSNRIIRTSILCDNPSTDRHGLRALKSLHFLLRLTSTDGICDIHVDPALTLINLLPCQVQCQLAESVRCRGLKGRKVVQTEEITIAVGNDAKCLSLDCRLKPHISIRLPGYRWSSWSRIVNRHANSQTWLPLHEEQVTLFDAYKNDVEHGNEYKTILHLDNKCTGGTSINLIMSVQTGHSPTIKLYSQYWIIDKTGCGLRFTDNFDIVGSKPDPDTLRKSFLTLNAANSNSLTSEMKRQGCEWSLGMNGMTLFFSRRERMSFSVVTEEEDSSSPKRQPTSRWSSFIDISKVMPKTVISVDDHDGSKRFEFAYNVTLCPSVFSRTMMITFFPRYQIANLLQEGLFVAQEGALDTPLSIPSQSWVPFHWENSSMPPKIRISSQSGKAPTLWSRGCIALDQIGITAIRVPSATSKKTVVVQVEVRLATKKQTSAVVVVIWSSIEKSNPLYTLRNNSHHTIFCSQPLFDDSSANEGTLTNFECLSMEDTQEESQHKIAGALGRVARKHQSQGSAREGSLKMFVKKVFRGECSGYDFSEHIHTGQEYEEFVWTLRPGESMGFGFDDPEMPHILEWTCLTSSALLLNGEDSDVGSIDLDKIGSISSVALLDGEEVKCLIKAEQSTKVVVFSNTTVAEHDDPCEDIVSLTFRIDLPGITVSIIDNISHTDQGRSTSDNVPGNNENDIPKEIILITTEGWFCNFSQTREGSHELEVKLDTIQVDNFIFNAEHPVLIFTPQRDNEPFLHCSIIRRLNEHESTLVISYAALRVLEIDICLDRKTAETLANFLHPFRKAREQDINIEAWISTLTLKMSSNYSKRSRRAPRDIEKMIHSANSGRLYVEHLHLHPIRLSLTFTQEWLDWNPATEGLIIFQLIRGMASIADAPLTFTSFLVGNAFESPQSLLGIIQAHYSSQLTNQVLTILGSLAILKAPVEFVSNVGSGVIRFFYEPINALVHRPAHFLESLESGTHHLARGVFTGFVRGAANLTYLVNNNLVTLASDEAFADTRRAYQRQLASSRTRSMEDSLSLAGACVTRGFQSGANGIFEQPAIYASRHGAVGLVKGVGKALVGAVVKPVVGVGDAAVVVMNHVSDAASEKAIVLKANKRMRRALPRISTSFGCCVNLIPYDNISAKAQQIVTGGETVDDAYLGHVTTPSHLIIASKQCLWAIDNDSREPWCVSWTEISHFSIDRGNSLTITVFSAQGPQSYVFDMPSSELAELYAILSTQMQKMGNMNSTGATSYANIQGMRSPQASHIFGSKNKDFKVHTSDLEDEVKLLEKCYSRVAALSSSTSDFFLRLDQEAWLLVNSWSQMFTGLSSRRCVSVGMLNGTLETIQIKSAKLAEGGSPCYSIPTREYEKHQGTLGPGGAIIIFGWGVPPSLLQPGRVVINIETNAFACSMPDRKEQLTSIQSLPGYHVGFLEKSYDESGWWAKYWILIQHDQYTQVN